jgi:peptidylprolyl isomerase
MKSKRRNLAIAAIVAIALTSLSACGGKDKVTDTASTGLPAVTANAGEAPTITAPTGTAPATLETKDIIVGTGTEVVASSTLTVQYTLMTWSDGKIIESSWTGGQPATFPLSGVIAGWQQGLPGTKVGGRRLLVIPADLGYGPNGSGPIGPNETLIFVVDIIGVS